MVASNFVYRSFSTFVLWGILMFGILADKTFVAAEYVLAFLILVVGTMALREFFVALEHKGIRSFQKQSLIGAVIFFAGTWAVLSGRVAWRMPPGFFELISLIVFLIGILSKQVFDRKQTTPIVTMSVTVFGMLYVVWLFSFIYHLWYFQGHDGRNAFLLLYLLGVTKITDIAAYLVGYCFGKHQLIPSVSPKKTWEGFIGGLTVAVFVSYALVWCLPDQLGTLIPLAWAPVLGLVISLVSVVGDLAESVVKRDAQIKDSGTWIPGIGGALDLIDSVLFTAPILFVFLKLYHG